jgi:hypothetical protein
MVGSDVDFMMEDGSLLFHFKCIAHTHEEIIEKLYFYCPFVHPAVMYKKESICQAGGYPTDAHNFEDYLLWTKIAKAGKFYNLPEALIKYRLNAASVTIDEKWRGKRFRQLKRTAVLRGSISANEGDELLAIIKSQDVRKIKEGSYHAYAVKNFWPIIISQKKHACMLKKLLACTLSG